ncbi:MAG: MmgE/PrpD family protein [Betaproteobacteria bacterium]
MEVTRWLAKTVVGSSWGEMPEAVRKEATRSFFNWLGCAIGGVRHEASEASLALALKYTGPSQATVVGTKHRLDIFHAAWVNGISSHVFDFDDTHLRTVIHPSPPIAPAVLALSEHTNVSGAEFVHALALGIEVACRIGNAVCPAHYNVGWHSTGTAGVFGAAVAVGKLLKLSEQQMGWALGLAGTQASGLRENLNTMGKFLHPGHAARDGMTAAFLAQGGFTASDRILEAPRGFAHVLSKESNLEEITSDWGKRYELLLNTYKPYPCGVVLHPVIDACLELVAKEGIGAGDIEKVHLKVNYLVLEVTGKRHPQVGVDGKFSVFHCVAVAFIDKKVEEEQFTDRRVLDATVVALSDRVDATVDTAMPADAVYMELTHRNGRKFMKRVEHARGSLKRPLSEAELERKFRGLCAGIVPGAQVDRLVEQCRALVELPDMAQVARLAAAA